MIDNRELEFVPFRELTDRELFLIGKSWANPINARYNGMRDPYGSAIELSKLDEPRFLDKDNYYDSNYYRAVFIKGNGHSEHRELVGTCRYGNYKVWDFGFNILLKHWFKGLGAQILKHIIEVEQAYGANRIRGGADIENFGSYKAMVRNGCVMSRDIDKELDSDGDFEYWLEDVQNYKSPTANKVKDNWDYHMQRVKARLGQIRMKCLDDVNKLVFGLVERLKAGEDEDKLLAEYMPKIDKLYTLAGELQQRQENGEDEDSLLKEYIAETHDTWNIFKQETM